MYAQLCLIIVFGIYLGKNYVSLSPKSVQNGLEYSIFMNIVWLASFLDIENLWFFFLFKYLFFSLVGKFVNFGSVQSYHWTIQIKMYLFHLM